MSVEKKIITSESGREEEPRQTLKEFLQAAQAYGIKTLSAESIKKQLEETGTAIVTREYLSGIRISRSGTKLRGHIYTVFVTNAPENPDDLIVEIGQKFAGKEIVI